jgi:hypothetical protein
MTVLDLEGPLFWKKFNDKFDIGRAHIRYGGITRHLSAANQAHDDPITMDAETAASTEALFSKYGFPGAPKTWVEFRPVHEYIQRIETGVDYYRIGFPHLPELGMEFLRTKYADVFEAAVLVIGGAYQDYTKVAALHRKKRTFKRLVKKYDERAALDEPVPMEFVPWPPHLR